MTVVPKLHLHVSYLFEKQMLVFDIFCCLVVTFVSEVCNIKKVFKCPLHVSARYYRLFREKKSH